MAEFDPRVSTEDVRLSEFLEGTLTGEFPGDDRIRRGTMEEVQEYMQARAFGDMPAYAVVRVGGTDWYLVYRNDGSVPVEDGEDPVLIEEGEEVYDEYGYGPDETVYGRFMTSGGGWATFVEAIQVLR